jgi:hypothetical protein
MRKYLSASPVKAGNNPLGLHDARIVPVDFAHSPIFRRIRRYAPYSWAFPWKLIADLSENGPKPLKINRNCNIFRNPHAEDTIGLWRINVHMHINAPH